MEGSNRRWRELAKSRVGLSQMDWGYSRLSQVDPRCRGVIAGGGQGLLFEEGDRRGQQRSLVKGSYSR